MDALDDRMAMIIELATIVEEHAMWPRDQVAEARQRLETVWGHVPTLEQLAQRTSTELVYQRAARVVDERERVQREIAEELGEANTCHLCGDYRDHHDVDYMFGLAKMIAHQRSMEGDVATLALTVPLGVLVAVMPGSTSHAYIKRCRLVLCATCGNKRRGGFWHNHELKVSMADCAKHPSFARLRGEGYTTFLDHRALQQSY